MKKFGVREFIVEELIEGVEYTIEGYKFKNGEHTIFGVSTKDKKFGFGVAKCVLRRASHLTTLQACSVGSRQGGQIRRYQVSLPEECRRPHPAQGSARCGTPSK